MPAENWSRNFSGGAGNGAARRIARITESSKAPSLELVPIFKPVSVPSGPIAKVDRGGEIVRAAGERPRFFYLILHRLIVEQKIEVL